MENKNIELGTEFSLDFIQTCYKLKPRNLFISEVKWKLLLRNILKSKNILMTGHSGTAKTMVSFCAAQALNRPFFKFDMGSMQDPRTSLIGNTHFNPEKGTYFNQSAFIEAIQTEYAVIILDEITRAHPDANNILLPVLDPNHRHIRLDEKEGQEVIKVAKGVSFIATANIGNEYTGTRILDRATLRRFSIIEMSMLTEEEELELLSLEFSHVENDLLKLLTKVSADVRLEYESDNATLSRMMSTAELKEAAELLGDGFSIVEALEVTLLPLFDESGGAASERQVVKTIIDGIVPKADELNKNLFNAGISDDNPFKNGLLNKKP